jgi:hypothetical protein
VLTASASAIPAAALARRLILPGHGQIFVRFKIWNAKGRRSS